MTKANIFVAALLIGSVLTTVAANPAPGQSLGLTVQEGQLRRGGKPYRGMGANYFDLFSRTLADPANQSYRQGLKTLSDAGIPFVRFMAGGFWPVDWDLYLQDKDTYFSHLDQVVRAAEENDIGLIPSLFWNMATVPDIVGEPIDQLGNRDSKTIGFIRQYTKETVSRYQSSPAIWGWEVGNEYNLDVDLPNASEHRPPVWPSLKTASTRTERDELSSSAMLTAYAEFAKTVREFDSHRIVITGNSVPRSSAYHNSKMNNWESDSDEQFREILLRDNPEPFSMLSVHVYPLKDNRYPGNANDIGSLIKTAQSISSKAGKPLFIGEFGAPQTLGPNEAQARFLELVTAIETNNVPLSAFWVFDYSGQDANWNVTSNNNRSYMLELVSAANQRLNIE